MDRWGADRCAAAGIPIAAHGPDAGMEGVRRFGGRLPGNAC